MTATLGNTVGVGLVSIILSACFLGILFLQAWNYFLSFPNDGAVTILTVVVVCILDATRVALNCHSMYHYLILHYGDMAELLIPVRTATVALGLTVTITLIVQLFYAYRCYHIGGRSLYIPLLVVGTSVAHFACGWFLAIRILQSNSFATSSLDVHGADRGMLTTAILADIMIASTLVYHFSKSRTGFKQTDLLLNRLTIYTINSNLLVTLTDVLVLVFAIVQADSWIYVAIFQLAGNFYSNSFLATLNSRALSQRPPNINAPTASSIHWSTLPQNPGHNQVDFPLEMENRSGEPVKQPEVQLV